MNEIEAYKAMQVFLEEIYNRTSSDDIGSLEKVKEEKVK